MAAMCEGLPNGPCPLRKKDHTVKFGQGELFLCPHCLKTRFPYLNNKPQTTATAAVALTTGTTAVAQNSVTESETLLKQPSTAQNTEGPQGNEGNSQTGDQGLQWTNSEVLCFVSNKINVMPYDMICKLCTDFYSDTDLEQAKDILFDTAFSHRDDARPRKIKRRGAGKKQSDMQDILNIFLEMPPDSVPIYVAKDLSNLPPLTMNTFDMSRIVKDMETLKLQVQILQEAQEANLTANLALAEDLLTRTTTSQESQETQDLLSDDAPEQVSETSDGTDSSPHGNSTESEHEAVNEEAESDDRDLLRLAEIQNLQIQNPRPKAELPVKNRINNRNSQNNNNNKKNNNCNKNSMSYANAARRNQRPSVSKSMTSSSGTPTTRGQPKVITGKGKDFSLRPAARGPGHRHTSRTQRTCTGIFVSRLEKHTKPRDVVQHIENELGMRCTCEQLQAKFNSYSSFLIRMSKAQRHRLLNPLAWPAGALVREYFE